MEHSFSISVARDFSVGAAIIVRHLQYWILINRANNINQVHGKTWTYNTHKSLSEIFPYWTPPQIKRILRALVDGGVIEKGYHAENKWDKTTWYSFQDEEKWLGPSALPEAFIQTARADDSVSSRTRTLCKQVSTLSVTTDINTNKEETINIPAWINQDSWDAFVEMRKQIKKPMSNRAKRLLISKLEAHMADGHDPNQLLDEAEFRRWQSIYPPKQNQSLETTNDNKEYFRNRGLQV